MSSLFFDTPRNVGQAWVRGLKAPATQLTPEERSKIFELKTELSKQRQILEIQDATLQRQVFGKMLDYTAAREKQESDLQKEMLKAETDLAVQTDKSRASKWKTVADTETKYLFGQVYGDQNTQDAALRAMENMATQSLDFAKYQEKIKGTGMSKDEMIENYMEARGFFNKYREDVSVEALALEGPSLQQVYRDKTAEILLKKATQEMSRALRGSGMTITPDDLKRNTAFGGIYQEMKGTEAQQQAAVEDMLTKRANAQRLMDEASEGGAYVDFSKYFSDDPSRQRSEAAAQAQVELPKGDPELRAAIDANIAESARLDEELKPKKTGHQRSVEALEAHPKKAFMMNLLGFTDTDEAAYYLDHNDRAREIVLELTEQATGNEPASEARRQLADSLGIGYMGTAPSALRIRHAIASVPMAVPAPAITAALGAAGSTAPASPEARAEEERSEDFPLGYEPGVYMTGTTEKQVRMSDLPGYKGDYPPQALPETMEGAQDAEAYYQEFYSSLSDEDLQGHIDRDAHPIAKKVMQERMGISVSAEDIGERAVEEEIGQTRELKLDIPPEENRGDEVWQAMTQGIRDAEASQDKKVADWKAKSQQARDDIVLGQSQEVRDMVKETGMSVGAAMGIIKQKQSGVANEGTPVPAKKKNRNPFENLAELPSGMGDF